MDTQPWSRFRAGWYSLALPGTEDQSPVGRPGGPVCGRSTYSILAVARARPSGWRLGLPNESVGVDRAPPMVDIARRRSAGLDNVRFEVGSAEALPFPDDAFTVVWAAHSFHHWENRRAGLAEVVRVLADGGRLLILEQDGKKHGLDDAGDASVMADMEELGFRDVKPEKVDDQLLISGSARP